MKKVVLYKRDLGPFVPRLDDVLKKVEKMQKRLEDIVEDHDIISHDFKEQEEVFGQLVADVLEQQKKNRRARRRKKSRRRNPFNLPGTQQG